MTRIGELLAGPDAGPTYSFEFSPPRTEEAEVRLARVLRELEPLHPSFVSVTYGAAGSTRDKTREVVEHIHKNTTMTPMPHLTCVAHTHAQVSDIVTGYRDAGLENLLALGGDAPADDGSEIRSDFRYATELIELAKSIGDFSTGVAAFPEGHPRSPDRDTDRRLLAAKLQAADFGITNFFFDAADYFRMRDELSALGVDKPVIPGIMLFVNVDGLRRMASLNACTIPPALDARLDAVDGKPGDLRALAVDAASELCTELLAGGAPGLHIYTLNYARATKELVSNLSLC